MAPIAGGGRRRSGQSCTLPPPADFWSSADSLTSVSVTPCSSCRGLSSFCRKCRKGTKEAVTAHEVSSLSSTSCSSCRGLSPFCRKCRKENTEALISDDRRAYRDNSLGDFRGSQTPHSPFAGDICRTALEPASPNSTLPRSLVRVPEDARPGDKIVLSRMHQVDDAGVCETSDWQCSLMESQATAPAPGSLTMSEVASTNADSMSYERLKQERQQFLEWGESLLKEVGLLEQEKLEIQASHEKSRHRCTELERLVRQGVAQSGAVVATADENDNLRKQLSAYSVEVDVLREERERLEIELAQSRAQTHGLSIEQEDLLTRLERAESLSASQATQDVITESGKESCEATLESRRELSFSGEDVLAADGAPSNQELLDCVGHLKRAFAYLQEEYVQQTNTFSDFVSKVKLQQQQADSEIQKGRKQELSDSATAEAAHTSNLHASEQQVSLLTHERAQMEEQCLETKLSLERQEQLSAEVSLKLLKFTTPQEEANSRRQRRLDTPIIQRLFQRALKFNIAWEMASAQQGFVVEKMSAKHPVTKAYRFVALFASDMALKWGKISGSEKLTSDIRFEKRHIIETAHHKNLATEKQRNARAQRLPALPDLHPLCKEGTLGYWTHSLDLRDVLRIDFGIMNRACVLSNSDPWLCFSLITNQRSYDFVCKDEECVRCLVLAISRLAPWACGAIKNRGDFAARKGWCKVHSHCQQNCMCQQSNCEGDGPRCRAMKMSEILLQAIAKRGAHLAEQVAVDSKQQQRR